MVTRLPSDFDSYPITRTDTHNQHPNKEREGNASRAVKHRETLFTEAGLRASHTLFIGSHTVLINV
jgi:hypothetical protein